MTFLNENSFTKKLCAWMMAFIIISLLITPHPLLHAEPLIVQFENKNLETIIRNKLNKPSGKLTAIDMASLKDITAHSLQITSLKGLEHAINLQKLSIVNSDVRDLSPIAKLDQLQSITFINNQISDLSPLKELKKLRDLDLSQNLISDLSPLATIKSLQTLNLSANLIFDIEPLHDLDQMYRLYLYDNYIEDLTAVQAMDRLNLLDVTGNLVSDLSPISHMKSLSVLYVNHNPIQSVEPIQDLRIFSLNISNSNVADLTPLKNLNNLQYLDIGNSLPLDQPSLQFLERFKTAAGNKVDHMEDYSPPKIFINGMVQPFAVRPEYYNNRIMTPLRSLLEWTGVDWSWNSKTRKVTLKHLSKEIILTIDSNELIENGKPRKIDVAPYIRDGYTMVPIRFVTEAFGFKLEYDDNLNWVKLTNSN
ncbi:stalk domain-containing protein [Paenibacillus sp. GCM10027627]|uniref:stalk domain-containing protein n=1 Tax=unclassified Paenibacillus TaxID=185978 RepID=UPI0036340A9F